MSELTDDRLRQIIDGCEGVPSGPWEVFQTNANNGRGEQTHVGPQPRSVAHIMSWQSSDRTRTKRAAHIARLDPHTVKAICTELLARRAAASTSTEGAGVKALEWQRENVDGTRWTGWGPMTTPYHVDHDGKKWIVARNVIVSEHDTQDEAKAAAQADYEARVRSCLNPPAPKVTTDEAEERG